MAAQNIAMQCLVKLCTQFSSLLLVISIQYMAHFKVLTYCVYVCLCVHAALLDAAV